MISTFTQDGAIYTVHEVRIAKTIFNVLVVTGARNYVSVRKVTSNPYGTLGTQFDNFDQAIGHYKNPEMKAKLLLIETGLA